MPETSVLPGFRAGLVALLLPLVLASGCKPLRNYAMGQLAELLVESSDSYHADDDPELIREAMPFTLKLLESTLAKTPRHRGLLLQTCTAFTEYAYGFVRQDADEIEDEDFQEARRLRQRAKILFLRARQYGLRALDAHHPDILAALRADPRAAAQSLKRDDVAIAYWLAACWGSAISVAKDDPDLVADAAIVEALLDRALALDEDYGDGAIHEALITYEMARQEPRGDPEQRARGHFARALELSQGLHASPYVNLAEAVSIQKQDAGEFAELLEKALAVDPDAKPGARTANLVIQRRARWLLSRKGDLFLDAGSEE